MHFNVVLDLGFDYGADGGLAWDTQVIAFPNGRTRRNQLRSAALGSWQLGNRTIDAEQLEYLQGFVHAMRGRAHTFLYRDWTDFRAAEQQLVVDGEATTQLIKAYGLAINGWVRDIRKPDPETVVIELRAGGEGPWVPLEAGEDYQLDASTGLVTWLISPPEAPDQVRWSGEFFAGVRFDRDSITAQFLGYEEGTPRAELAYQIGDLAVVEDPEA